ncbi:MAG: B12-binding domain-containing radical SAM protein, partial [Nanoarchaeota archaeon]|nr:B12-binding domain-containing radical SAM protein [Nanoarchaeota archaeon]
GGFGPTFRAEEYSRYADYVVIGEGETTTEELFLSLAGSGVAVDEIKGLGFRRNGEYVFTGERDNLKPSELELVHPDYDKATLSQLSTVPIESSRGCPKNCNFCSVTGFYGRSYRTKSREWVVEELGRMNSYGKGIFFTDDNFTGKKSRCVALLEQIIESGLNKREGVAQVTINAASNDSLLDLMWNAGIRTLCIGIESINDETLEAYSKRVSAEQNKEAIKIFKERGFWVHGMMMPGGDGDTPESLRETSEWANKDLDSVQYFSPIPLPGTRMRSQLEEEGRILRDGEDDLWHLYDGDNVLIRPKNFTPLQLQKTIYKMYDSFYSWKKGLSKALKSRDFRAVKIALGLLAYTKLKGEKILYSPESKRHLEFLESVS